MISSRNIRVLAAMAGALVFAADQPARADGSHGGNRGNASQLAAARQQFLGLLALRDATGRPDPIPFDPVGVRAFNRQLSRLNGRTPSVLVSDVLNFPPERAFFRANYTYELYRTRALNNGGYAGGLFFTPPQGTPVVPVSPVNIFTFFPVFTFGV